MQEKEGHINYMGRNSLTPFPELAIGVIPQTPTTDITVKYNNQVHNCK